MTPQDEKSKFKNITPICNIWLLRTDPFHFLLAPNSRQKEVLGGGLEPPRLAAYAPQTYVSAISPSELFCGAETLSRERISRKQSLGHGKIFPSLLFKTVLRPEQSHGGLSQ